MSQKEFKPPAGGTGKSPRPAPQQAEDRLPRVVDLARELYLATVLSSHGKKPEAIVKEAFERSVVFWTHADRFIESGDPNG